MKSGASGMVDEGAVTGQDEGPPIAGTRINGVVDLPSPTRVTGWAIDRSDPDAHVIVRISRNGTTIAEVPATTFRADLERGGVGSGRYGFSFDLDEPVPPGMAFTIKARGVAADGAEAVLRRIGQAASSADSDRLLLEEIYLSLQELRGTRPSDGAPENQSVTLAALSNTCDRLEAVQARIESALHGQDETVEQSIPTGLKIAVWLALTLGAGSLTLGILSMLPK